MRTICESDGFYRNIVHRILSLRQPWQKLSICSRHALGHHVMNAFLEDIKAGLFCLDFAITDIARAQELANKYQNLPLGLTDAFVIACAERNGGAVLSLDEHFWIVSGEGKLKMHSLE
jgi:uncharacterized protein